MDIKCFNSKFEPPPSAMTRVPFWQMRAISSSIKSGGFLTPNLYVPRMVWFQPGAKFSGKFPTPHDTLIAVLFIYNFLLFRIFHDSN